VTSLGKTSRNEGTWLICRLREHPQLRRPTGAIPEAGQKVMCGLHREYTPLVVLTSSGGVHLVPIATRYTCMNDAVAAEVHSRTSPLARM